MIVPESLRTVGVSHKTAPLAVRERFAFPPAVVRDLLAEPGGESLLLVTCNRTELYGLEPADRMADRLLRATGPGVEGSVLFALEGTDTARHLFSVAAGLDSMVVGEPQILGQVKRAMRTAREAGSLGTTLDGLARRALTVGRRVRRETALGAGSPSIPKVAVAVAKLVLGDLTGRSLLVVGTGKLGGLTAHTLRRAGAATVVVTNRTQDAAAELAVQIGGRAEPFDALDRLLADADIVISCTASQQPILTRARVEAVLSSRPGRPLVVVDIAVPRDVEADVRSLAGVKLFDLDDLRGWGSAAIPPDAIAAARAIVEAETREFLAWHAGRAAVPMIRALQERADTILESELERVRGDQADAMRAFGRRLVAKLLHHPMRRMRTGAATDGDAYLAVARDLFALDSENGDRDRA